jgi:DNA transformation protein and related proteins
MASTKSAGLDFAQYACELLASVGPCVAKRMFGGFGISTGGLTLALVADLGSGLQLWLKADDTSRAQFEAAGCARFSYLAAGVPKSMNYYSAPDDALESPHAMAPWARLALDSALKARVAGAKPRSSVIKKVASGDAPAPRARRASAAKKRPRSTPD